MGVRAVGWPWRGGWATITSAQAVSSASQGGPTLWHRFRQQPAANLLSSWPTERCRHTGKGSGPLIKPNPVPRLEDTEASKRRPGLASGRKERDKVKMLPGVQKAHPSPPAAMEERQDARQNERMDSTWAGTRSREPASEPGPSCRGGQGAVQATHSRRHCNHKAQWIGWLGPGPSRGA